MLRETVRRVRQLLGCVLRHAVPMYDDRRVRLRLEFHEPRKRLPTDIPVRVYCVRATGTARPVRGHTRGGAVVRPVPDVRRHGQTVPGQRVVRHVAADITVPYFTVRVPLKAQLPRGRVLRRGRVPGADRLVMLVHRLRHAAPEMV